MQKNFNNNNDADDNNDYTFMFNISKKLLDSSDTTAHSVRELYYNII